MISGWSSEHFYSGLLSADPSIASISLDQLLSSNTGQYPEYAFDWSLVSILASD